MFEPGKSGNPNGRPKQKPFLDWCKKWTLEKAEKHLAPIAEKTGSKNQLEAIKLIMAYAIGKPVEFQESSHQFEGLAQDPHSIKSELEQLIAGESAKSRGTDTGNAAVQGEGTA